MPLIPGKGNKPFSHNVAAEINAGKPQKQALAIAYSEQAKKMAEGGDVDDMDQMLDQVAGELLDAIEKKDKHALMEALEALVLHISDKDEQSDMGQS